jgi:hypothetical protein
MSCHHLEPHIVDMARGVTSDQDAKIARHVLWCPSCAGLLERERAMSAALRRLAKDLKEPADNPQREAALLAMFDHPGARPRSRVHQARWTGLVAAGVVLTVMLGWRFGSAPEAPDSSAPSFAVALPETRQQQTLEPDSYMVAAAPVASATARRGGALNADLRSTGTTEPAEFVAWPGAGAWPSFESGEVIRIDIPTDAGVVAADVLVDQDGFARAIRLVQ